MKTQRKNMTENIRNTLEDMILRGELRSGERMASNAELAKIFSVSTLTADRAVRQLVQAGLVYRKHGVGTFVAESPRRITDKKYHIGIADTQYPASSIWDKVVGVLSRTSINFFYSKHCDIKMLDYDTVYDAEKFKAATENLDGLLVSYAFIDSVTLENLKTFAGPVVISDVKIVNDLPFHQVVLDIRHAVREAVSLLMLNPPEKVFIIYENDSTGIDRRNCFAAILLEAGYDEKKIHYFCPQFEKSNHADASEKLGHKIVSEIHGNFIFCTSDIVSLKLLDVFQEYSFEPHRDFQLLSCDNLEWVNPNRKTLPVLTTIDLAKEYRATKAAELLLQSLNQPCKNETVIIKIRGELTIRDTAF
jgi:DNA-binding LacI/PurR family transcriptional regulator/DNA-binding transcriptional regulator YhcF (GntR family)